MSTPVRIVLTVQGANTGPFALYTNLDGYTTPFDDNGGSGIPGAWFSGPSGYLAYVPDGASVIRVCNYNNPLCDTCVDLYCLSTTTSSTTIEPTISTTTTVYSGESYEFNVLSGYFPVHACVGVPTTVYSNVESPGVGDFIYKDSNLTQPWDVAVGSSLLFVDPDVHGGEVAGVAVVDTDVYDLGEIMLLTDYWCYTTTSTTTSPTSTTTTTEIV